MKVKNKISLNLGLNLDPRCEGAPAVMVGVRDGQRNYYIIQISVFKKVTGMRVLLHIYYYTYDIYSCDSSSICDNVRLSVCNKFQRCTAGYAHNTMHRIQFI